MCQQTTREVLEILPYFGAQPPSLFAYFFWSSTRPRGLFKARKGVKSCSPTYSKHIYYLVANFGPIDFLNFFEKKLHNVWFWFLSVRRGGDVKFVIKK